MADWPHAPLHRLNEAGAYIITAGTYHKEHILRSRTKLDYIQQELLRRCLAEKITPQGWALFSNHYHVIVTATNAAAIKDLMRDFHSATAIQLNSWDDTPGRRVWFEYWDTYLSTSRSYLCRLRYVHQNPVRHGLAQEANLYPWCSAAWFTRNASPALLKTVESFKIDRVSVYDEFEPVEAECY